jgi:hypothetical protein
MLRSPDDTRSRPRFLTQSCQFPFDLLSKKSPCVLKMFSMQMIQEHEIMHLV